MDEGTSELKIRNYELGMQFDFSPIQELESDFLQAKKVRLFVKREDVLHPEIGGNKWRKLKYNLRKMRVQKRQKLLTFGGAFSNHVSAVAAAGKLLDFQTIGIIRGEKIEPLNPTLARAEANGMQLHFINRTSYRTKYQIPFQAKLKQQFGDFYLLPEGGTNAFALPGCAEIMGEIEVQMEDSLPNYVCVPCGTGGTISGLISSKKRWAKILGFSVLKGDFLRRDVEQLLTDFTSEITDNWQINTDYHFGGYARSRPELLTFINDFYRQFGIPLEPIYTGKMLYGIFDLIEKNYFEKGAKVMVIHTGGLQGIEGRKEFIWQ